MLKYLGGDGEGEVSSTAAVHRHVRLLHAMTLLAHLEAKEVQVGQEMRPSPSASGKVNVLRLRQPQKSAGGDSCAYQVLQHEGHQFLLQGFHQRCLDGIGVVLHLAVGADPAGQHQPVLGAKRGR